MTTSALSMSIPLGPFGQQSFLNRLYTQISNCYSMNETSQATQDRIVSTFQSALVKLTESFPWISGKAIKKDGVFTVVNHTATPQLVVKDYTSDETIPSFAEMASAGFPMAMLDEKIIAPRDTLSLKDEEDWPVLLIQLNFVRDGLILTVNTLHSVMDMSAQGQIMWLLHKACNNISFTKEEIDAGNMDHTKITELLEEDYKPGPEVENQIAKPKPLQVTPEGTTPAMPDPADLPVSEWCNFSFSAKSLSQLKKMATESLPKDGTFVSTDDTLSAFVWKHTTRARLNRLKPDDKTTFARAIDGRKYVGAPSTYTGIVQNMTYNTFTFSDLIASPLGVIASQMRGQLQLEKEISYRTRALATILARTPEEERHNISVTATLNIGNDIMLSSWVKERCYELDFNMGLGKPEFVRRPRCMAVESLMYLLPKRSDGEIVVALCLRKEDLDHLKADEEWGEFGKCLE